jgi:hypothetical protein
MADRGYQPFEPFMDSLRVAVPLVISQRKLDADKEQADMLFQQRAAQILMQANETKNKFAIEEGAKILTKHLENYNPNDPESVKAALALGKNLESLVGQPFLPRDETGNISFQGLNLKPGMTEYQKESLDLRSDLGKQAALDREEARKDRQAIAGQSAQARQDALELQRQNAEERKRQNLRGEQGTKPEKGMRWNADTGEMEPIPGSTVDIKIREDYAADTGNIESVTNKLDILAKSTDEIINHKGLPAITGYRGYIPDVFNPAAMDADKLLKSFKSKTFVNTIQEMRNAAKTGSTGLGQLTEREGDKLENSIESLERAQSYEQMIQALKRIKQYSELAKSRIKKQYDLEWEGRVPKKLGEKQNWKKENLDLKNMSDDELKKGLGL